ncbi:hypothetical protein S40288_10363, partial [Stachybotrys chartarum IBT 40288]
MATLPQRPATRREFEIALICALTGEADAVAAVFDHHWDDDGPSYDKAPGDPNAYSTGVVGRHNVVLAHMPGMGTVNAAAVASNCRTSFPNIKLALVVGICGVTPFGGDRQPEIVLGDVVISDAVIQYDLGRQRPDRFVRKDTLLDSLGRPNMEIRALLAKLKGLRDRRALKANMVNYLDKLRADPDLHADYPGIQHDRLFESSYSHAREQVSCEELGCNGDLVPRTRLAGDPPQPDVHFGLIASSNTVMKSGAHRDAIAADEHVAAFEMEGVGVWDILPCLVIKGACDYADSHKNKKWQYYAAATAAACMKAFLHYWAPSPLAGQDRAPRSEGHAPTEIPPCPSIVIPFSRDQDFVNRGTAIDQGTVLDQIIQKRRRPGSRTALVGLGGVGKSQVAIEYTYRVREQSPETWVFWIHASNATRFEQSIRDIADCAKIYGRQNPKANIFQLVHGWLQDRTKGPWVLILDNLDDAQFLTSSSGGSGGDSGDGSVRPLLSYIPHCQHGSVLVTSRNRSAALEVVEESNIIEVEPMNVKDAVTLFGKKFHQPISDDAFELVTTLVDSLEYMPLAIVQAAAYISQRWPRCSFKQYLDDYQASDRKKTGLLSYEGGKLRRDANAKNSILITWQISFDHIRQVRQSAADLLSFMSFCDRQGIPEMLLRNHDPNKEVLSQELQRNSSEKGKDEYCWSEDDSSSLQSDSSNIDTFEDDVLLLRNYSFVTANEDGYTFEMHRLVQLATLEWLELHKEKEKWRHQFLTKLCKEMPTGKYENWAICRTLFPHAQSAAAQLPKTQDSRREWATVLYRAAWYCLEMGNGIEAERLSVLAMKARKRLLEADDEDVLWSMAIVAWAYRNQGQWKDAEELEVQV